MDSPAHIIEIDQHALRLRLMLWTEGARWRVAWKLAAGGPWHGLARRFASEEEAREQAISGAASYLRHGRRRAAAGGRGYQSCARSLASELRARSAAPVSAQALRAASADMSVAAIDDTLFERALKLAFPQARRHR